MAEHTKKIKPDRARKLLEREKPHKQTIERLKSDNGINNIELSNTVNPSYFPK
jgi:hypothetical protein